MYFVGYNIHLVSLNRGSFSCSYTLFLLDLPIWFRTLHKYYFSGGNIVPNTKNICYIIPTIEEMGGNNLETILWYYVCLLK